MRTTIASVEAEYRRYKTIADAALAQLDDEEVKRRGPGNGSSVAIIVWHLGGNLDSRFTDFLTSDGEKPWRDRDGEFEERKCSREELITHWNRGWTILFETLGSLDDSHLASSVQIRGTDLRVDEALHRSLAHTSYHVGQLVYLAKAWKGASWKYLSIAPGKTADYNRNPTMERAAEFTKNLRESGEGPK